MEPTCSVLLNIQPKPSGCSSGKEPAEFETSEPLTGTITVSPTKTRVNSRLPWTPWEPLPVIAGEPGSLFQDFEPKQYQQTLYSRVCPDPAPTSMPGKQHLQGQSQREAQRTGATSLVEEGTMPTTPSGNSPIPSSSLWMVWVSTATTAALASEPSW